MHIDNVYCCRSLIHSIILPFFLSFTHYLFVLSSVRSSIRSLPPSFILSRRLLYRRSGYKKMNDRYFPQNNLSGKHFRGDMCSEFHWKGMCATIFHSYSTQLMPALQDVIEGHPTSADDHQLRPASQRQQCPSTVHAPWDCEGCIKTSCGLGNLGH